MLQQTSIQKKLPRRGKVKIKIKCVKARLVKWTRVELYQLGEVGLHYTDVCRTIEQIHVSAPMPIGMS
jgi:hypothetical protein